MQVEYLETRFVDRPAEMLEEFCRLYDFEPCRKWLWNMLKGFLASEYADQLQHTERGDYLVFYEQVQALIESVFLMYDEKMKNRYFSVSDDDMPT